ncbi:Heat shock protein 22.5 (Hsp22.5) [Actinokineospora spheciospongiae]|uniref:Heat shock protein 22.5 (Hsp22.5) n=1 Tax=Actinokineospora spheciospongiae TaxID=909613 RepID=W7J0Q3_9PSEU|nr:SAF domain-containing protein [Actinokineospora spheciospongiae]EWC59699.1 Heat shock protein 22.5 (Hsp22.5) [Actinokineospora spheciospongiae]
MPASNPTLIRLRALRATLPRALALRRVVAGVLLLAAAATTLWHPAAEPASTPVLVAAKPLSAATALTPTDVRVVRAPPDLLPAGALTDPAEAAGRLLAGPAAEGEPITRVRLVGAENTALAVGPGAAAVPLRPADPTVSSLLRPGSRVDVVAAAEPGDPPEVLAENATVLTVRALAGGGPNAPPLLLLALPERAAHDVAAASLRGEVTVTLR